MTTEPTDRTALLDSARPVNKLDASMVLSLVAVGVVAAAMALIALAFFNLRAGIGVGIGGLIGLVNLWVFAHIVSGVLAGGQRGKLWGLVGGLKFIALFAAAYLVLKSGWASGLTLAIGYGALPLGITIGALLSPRAPSGPDEAAQAGSGGEPDLLTATPSSEQPDDEQSC